MMPERPLENFSAIRSRSVGTMREALARTLNTEPTLDVTSREKTLDAVYNTCRLRHAGLSYLTYGAPVTVKLPSTDFFSQLILLKGAGRIAIGGTSVSAAQGTGVASSPGSEFSATFDGQYEQLSLRLDPTALTAKLAAILDKPIGRALQVDVVQNPQNPSTKFLHHLFSHFVHELSVTGLPFSALLLSEIEQALMVAYLYGNQHNYSHLLECESPRAAPGQIRRAEEYIEAHCDRPISVEDIAAACGASVRSVFRLFKQSRGYSPMEFAKQVRLRRAKQMLDRANAPTTVADVALTCGFADLGRFSKEYRRSFGERPSETLRRSKAAAA